MTTKEQRDELTSNVPIWLKSHSRWESLKASHYVIAEKAYEAGRASALDSQQPASVDVDSLIHELNTIAQDCNGYEYGLPIYHDEVMEQMRSAVKAVLHPAAEKVK